MKHVEKKVEACQCLLCEQDAVRRGLCVRHYGRFRIALLAKKSEADRAKFEAAHIRDGNLLPPRPGRRADKSFSNPFAE